MEEKEKSRRIRMLELLTNEENNLMLYDALPEFVFLKRAWYAPRSFLLYVLRDNVIGDILN